MGARPVRARLVVASVGRPAIALGRSGGDRLSRALRHSTMGAGAFNGRVRDGIGFWAHRSNHQTGAGQEFGKRTDSRSCLVFLVFSLVSTGPPGCASLAAAEPGHGHGS